MKISDNYQNGIPGFRSVPLTGVIYVMNRAMQEGYSYGNNQWFNLGQGAQETGVLAGAPKRIKNVKINYELCEYGPVAGTTELRKAVADFYNKTFRKNKRSKYSYRNVAISGGGRAGLARIASAFGGINLGHFIPDYTAYEELLSVFKAFNPIPILLDQNNGYQISISDLQKEIYGRGLSALLVSNPSNPTGRHIIGSELAQWVALASEAHCTFVFDEFYSHYVFSKTDNPLNIVSAAEYIEDVNKDPIVIIDGLTKNWRYPGWRISWTLAPEKVIESITSAGSFLDGGANHILQKAAISLLDTKNVQQETRAIQTVFKKKRNIAVKKLRQLGFVIDSEPQGSFYVFARLDKLPRSLRDGMTLFEKGLEEKVITVPGQFFDVNPGKRRQDIHSQYKNYTRISFGPNLRSVQGGLAALQRVIAKHI